MLVDPFGLAPGDLFDSPEEAAADFGLYIGQQSIEEEEEYASYIYEVVDENGNGNKYYYDEPRNDLETHEDREISFSISWSGTAPFAVVHAHGAYDVDTGNVKDGFSFPGNVLSGNDSFSDTAQSDSSGLDYYVVTPAGNLGKYISNSGDYNGILIRSDMPVDVKYTIHQELQNTQLYPLLQMLFPYVNDEEIVSTRKKHISDSNWESTINDISILNSLKKSVGLEPIR